jgi:hypothetical protein
MSEARTSECGIHDVFNEIGTMYGRPDKMVEEGVSLDI